VVNAGIAQDGFHLTGQLGRNQASGFQQVIEAGDLQGRGTVREVVHGVTHRLTAFAVGTANPQAAVVCGVVEANAGRLQLICQIAHAHPIEHFSSGAVGRNTDHAGERVSGGRVELHVSRLDA
jgi:hypothetical protein